MKRTNLQNSSIHSWFTEVSRELNNSGIDFKVLVSSLRVDATPELVKSVFRQIGEVKFGKKSTAELTTKELQECWEEMNRLLASVGVHCPFHSQENTEEYNLSLSEEAMRSYDTSLEIDTNDISFVQ